MNKRMIFYVAVAFVILAVPMLLNVSRVKAVVLENFEDVGDWTYAETDTAGVLSGKQDTAWKTSGSNSYALIKVAGGTPTVGDNMQISKLMDLSGSENLIFDIKMENSGWYQTRIYIDDNKAFETNVSGVTENTVLNVKHYTDNHLIIFCVYFNEVNDANWIVYIDTFEDNTLPPPPNVAPVTYNLDVGSTAGNNCVLYLNLDENSGQLENRVYDSSGENNHGTLENFNYTENSGWVVGRRGTALLFDGENDFVNCGNDSSLDSGSGSFSFEAWIEMSSVGTTQMIVEKYDSILDVGWFLSVRSDDIIYIDVYDGENDMAIFSSVELSVDTWYYVTFTYDGVTGVFYLNGVFDNSEDGSGVGVVDTTAGLFIGRQDRDDFPFTFNGIIDEVRLYNRALTVEEVENHYTKNRMALLDLVPLISWSYYDANGEPCVQSEILVGSTPGAGDMWTYLDNTSLTFIEYGGTTLVQSETYYLRIRAHDGIEWGDAENLTFRMALVSPIPTPRYTETLVWSEDHADENYDIQIDDDPDFSSLVHQENNHDGSSYAHTFDDNGVFYWRVRAISIDNLTSEWSLVQTIWVNTPPPSTWGMELGVVGVCVAIVAIAVAAKRVRKDAKSR